MIEIKDLNNITYDYYHSIANRYNNPDCLSKLIDKYFCGIAIGHNVGGFKECVITNSRAIVKYDYIYDRDKTKIVKYEVVVVINTKKNKIINHYLKLIKDDYANNRIEKIFDNFVLNLEYKRFKKLS